MDLPDYLLIPIIVVGVIIVLGLAFWALQDGWAGRSHDRDGFLFGKQKHR